MKRLCLLLTVLLLVASPAFAAPTVKDYQIDWGTTDPEVDADDLPVDSGAWSNLNPLTDTAQAVFDWIDTNWGSLLSITGVDQAVVRMDGTSGIEDSGWFISDSDALTCSAGSVSLSGSSAGTVALFQNSSTGWAVQGNHTGSGAGAGVGGFTASSNNTAYGGDFDHVQIADYADIGEAAAPITPATGRVRIYAKTDGLLYSKDDAGTETLVSGGSFSGIGLETDLGTPATLSDGDTLSIGGGDGISTSNSGDAVTVAVDRTVARDYGTKTSNTSVDNTTSKTPVYSWTVDADDWESGTQCQLRVYFKGTAVSSPTLTITVEDGTNTLYSVAITAPSGGQFAMTTDALFTCRSTGGSGSIAGEGNLLGLNNATTFYLHSAHNTNTTDTTSSNTYTVYAQWSATHPANTLDVENAGVLRIN